MTARTVATQCRDLTQTTDEPMLAVLGPFALSLVEEAEGRMDAAGRLALEAVAAARAVDDPSILGWPLVILGGARCHAGDLHEATLVLDEALSLFRRVGGFSGESTTLMYLAGLARAEGDLAGAARLHADSIRVSRDAGVLAEVFDDLVGIAEIAESLGFVEPAARLLGAEDTYCTVFGSVGWGVTAIRRERTRQAVMEQLGNEQFRKLWDAGRALSIEEAIDEALVLADGFALNQL